MKKRHMDVGGEKIYVARGKRLSNLSAIWVYMYVKIYNLLGTISLVLSFTVIFFIPFYSFCDSVHQCSRGVYLRITANRNQPCRTEPRNLGKGDEIKSIQRPSFGSPWSMSRIIAIFFYFGLWKCIEHCGDTSEIF